MNLKGISSMPWFIFCWSYALLHLSHGRFYGNCSMLGWSLGFSPLCCDWVSQSGRWCSSAPLWANWMIYKWQAHDILMILVIFYDSSWYFMIFWWYWWYFMIVHDTLWYFDDIGDILMIFWWHLVILSHLWEGQELPPALQDLRACLTLFPGKIVLKLGCFSDWHELLSKNC